MADGSYTSKVYRKQGGNELVVASGGKVTVEAGGAIILPTADPHVVGALWNNAGTITVSAG
ncbi:hypothetical protein [Mesorhizobium sp.]|uniref:hypothetical protein n=1 Tax=Mesorhizobium sp. TaxID=1871066 RepID=UPI000FE78BC4|nr:hypothetical protein [Mesorhizobium sp.]RWB65399.1 MAG: hypothetical protein EOQ49_32255 [Mesorhizobium sp.]